MDYGADERFSFFQQVNGTGVDTNDKSNLDITALGNADAVYDTSSGHVKHYKHHNVLTNTVRGEIKDWCVYKHKLK